MEIQPQKKKTWYTIPVPNINFLSPNQSSETPSSSLLSWFSTSQKLYKGSLSFIFRTKTGKIYPITVNKVEDLLNQLYVSILKEGDSSNQPQLMELSNETATNIQETLIYQIIDEIEVFPTPPLDLRFEKWPEFLSLFNHLKKLVLLRHGFAIIEPSIAKFEFMEHLSLRENKINFLPNELGNLKFLKELDLSHNQIVTLPPTIGKLENLVKLDLSNNLIVYCPENLNLLIQLQSINLSHNKISKMSPLNNLSNLAYLDLSHNSLSCPLIGSKNFLTELNGLNSLQILDLSYNYLTEIVSSIEELISLEELKLFKNQIKAVKITELTAQKWGLLKRLDLGHNKIVELSPEIGKLRSLNTLFLQNNALSDLPQTIENIPLERINLGHNQLKTIPLGICLSPTLRKVFLDYNSIKAIPVDIMKAEKLSYLDLSHNSISSIAQDIMLPHLSFLNLSNNNLLQIPSSFGTFTKLKTLELNENPELTLLPRSLVQLENLSNFTIANISVTKKHENFEEKVINTPVKVKQLVMLTKICQHPFLCRALIFVAKIENYQDEFIAVNGLEELNTLATEKQYSMDKVALETLEKLCCQRNYKEHIYNGCINTFEKLLNSPDDPEIIASVLRSLSLLCLNEKVKREISSAPYLKSIRDMLSSDNAVISNSVRLLHSSLGIDTKLLNKKRGCRILSIDGGGIRGLVAIIILKKIEEITQVPIYELFDLIVGTSTGSIIATLIGIKRLSMDRIQTIYTELVASTFVLHSNTLNPDLSPRKVAENSFFQAYNSIVNVSSFLKKGSWYRTTSFEELIKGITGDHSLIVSALNTDTKVCMVSTLMSVYPLEPYLFRNYNIPQDYTNTNYKGECDTSIIHAIRSSTSAPGYFDSMKIDGQVFRDGGMIANNPAGIAINQAKMLWPDRPIDLLLSCGTGRENAVTIDNANSYKQLINQIVNSCSETEKTHKILSDLMPPQTYYRFQPFGDIFGMSLDETDIAKINELKIATTSWIDAHAEEIQTFCSLLTGENS